MTDDAPRPAGDGAPPPDGDRLSLDQMQALIDRKRAAVKEAGQTAAGLRRYLFRRHANGAAADVAMTKEYERIAAGLPEDTRRRLGLLGNYSHELHQADLMLLTWQLSQQEVVTAGQDPE